MGIITLGYKQEQKEQTEICEKLLRWADIQDSNSRNFLKEVKRIINHHVKSKERELRKKKKILDLEPLCI